MKTSLNKNLYNMIRSSLYYETLDFKSKLLQMKTGSHTKPFF